MEQRKFNHNLVRTVGMLTSARRVAMLLVTLLLTMTAQTAGAEVTYQWDDGTKTLTFSGSGEIPYDMVYNSGHMENVETVVIGSGVTSIRAAFSSCSNLETVTFEAGSQLTSIGEGAFNVCSKLTSIAIPASVTSIGQYAFLNCTNLTSIAIPASVTTIGDGTFDRCLNLTSIIIPASVTSIGYRAFYMCQNLAIVVVQRYNSGDITTLGADVFDDCDALAKIYVPDDALDAYKGASNWSQYYLPTVPGQPEDEKHLA